MIVHQATLRLVGTVDIEAVIQEISEGSLEDVVGFVMAVVASHGPDAKDAAIAALTSLYWEEEELEEEEDLEL